MVFISEKITHRLHHYIAIVAHRSGSDISWLFPDGTFRQDKEKEKLSDHKVPLILTRFAQVANSNESALGLCVTALILQQSAQQWLYTHYTSMAGWWLPTQVLPDALAEIHGLVLRKERQTVGAWIQTANPAIYIYQTH